MDVRRNRVDEILVRKKYWEELSPNQVSLVRETVESEGDNSEWLSQEKIKAMLRITLKTESFAHANLVNVLFLHFKRYNDQRVSPKAITDELPENILPALIQALAIVGNDLDALTLCAESSPPQLKLYHEMLNTYRKENNLVGFLKARDFMIKHKLLTDTDILNMHLELLNSNELYTDAHTLYLQMSEDGQARPDWKTRLTMLEVYMKASSQEKSVKSSSQYTAFGERVYLELQKDVRGHVEEVYPELLAWSVSQAYSLEEIHMQVRDMEGYGMDLDIDTINTMLLAAAVSKQWLLIETLWNSFQRPRIYPTERTFSLRIEAAVMSRNQEQAKSVFEQCKSAGFSDMIDPVALQTLLASELMGSSSDPELCSYILQLLEKVSPFPITPTTLAVLIPNLLSTNTFLRAERVLRMSQRRPDWNPEAVIEIILDFVKNAEDEKSVVNTFTLLKNLFWDDPLYTLEARETLLRQAIKIQSGQKATQMFTRFLTSKIKPDEQTYNMLLKGGIELRDFGMVRKIHQCMKMDVNLSEHTSILNTLMLAYSHLSSSLAFDVWEQISRSGRGPSQATVSIVIDTCTHARLPMKGQHIWRTLERSNFTFNDNNYASYVELLNKNSLTDKAISVLTQALAEKQQVGARAVSTLYNTAAKKELIQEWALDQCPDIWEAIPRK